MIKVLVVDRYTLVRSGLRALLDAQPDMEVAAEAADGEGALAAARRHRPRVILLNVDLPGLGGLETARRLRRLDPAPGIVGLGSTADGPYPLCLMEVGASGFLTKHCAQDELVAAVRRVAQGRRYVAAELAQAIALDKLDGPASPIRRLTPRELAVMVLVSRGDDRHAISSKLSVSPKTVSTYRTRLMRKLGASSDVELTHLSLRHGLIES